MSKNKSPINLMLISLILMSAIFVIDLQLPLGVAGGVPYVAVILVSLWFHNKKCVIGLAIACTILTLVGFYFSPEGGELWKVVANRTLAIFAIWTTATLAVQWQVSQKRLLLNMCEAEKKKEVEKKEIYVATMRSAMHITNNLLNQLMLVQLEIENHKDFNQGISASFDETTTEASALLTKLSSVKEIEAEKIEQSVYPEKAASK